MTVGLAETDRAVLEDFVVDNRDLDQLEALLTQFNIFEALVVIRQDLRHSEFLAFLLDPRQNHGLGGHFPVTPASKGASRRALRPARMSPIDLDGWNLAESYQVVASHPRSSRGRRWFAECIGHLCGCRPYVGRWRSQPGGAHSLDRFAPPHPRPECVSGRRGPRG